MCTYDVLISESWLLNYAIAEIVRVARIGISAGTSFIFVQCVGEMLME